MIFGAEVIWQLLSRISPFDFYSNTSSLTFFKVLGFLQPIYSVLLYLTYSISHHLLHKVGRTSIYNLKEYSAYSIYLYFIYLLKYEVIIFDCPLVTKGKRLVGYNQNSSFIKLSVLLLVLVRVLAKWQGSTFSMSLILVKVLAR